MSRLTELYKQQSIKVGAEADAAKNAAQEKELHEGVIKNTKYLQMQSAYHFCYKDYYQETSPIELSSQKQALFCEATKLVQEDKWSSFVDATNRKPYDLESIDGFYFIDADGCYVHIGGKTHKSRYDERCFIMNRIAGHLGRFQWADGSIHCTNYDTEITTEYLRSVGLFGTMFINRLREKATQECMDKMRKYMDVVKATLYGEQKYVYLHYTPSGFFRSSVRLVLFKDGMIFVSWGNPDPDDSPRFGLDKFTKLTMEQTEEFIAKEISRINLGTRN